MILYLLRGAFVLLAASVTMLYVLPFQSESKIDFPHVLIMTGMTLGVSLAIIAVDVFIRRKKLAAISGLFLGVVAGLVVSFALSFIVDLIGLLVKPQVGDPAKQISFENLLTGVKVFIGLVSCYIATSLVLQTKDSFRFVIPYVEFAKQIRGNRPIIVDTNVVIDGRILDILETKLIQTTLVIPRFIIGELQLLADSADKTKRARGRRGLEILQKLRETTKAEVTIDDSEFEPGPVDQMLVQLAQSLQGRLMTNDFNLNKVATLHGVDVINLNDLAKALRPVVLPGEKVRIKIAKPGEGVNQGVGYLDDGTMVVAEGARTLIGQEVDLLVTSTLQTSAGRMVFGKGVSDDPASPLYNAVTPAPPTKDDPNIPRGSTRPGYGRNPRR
jgi:uncharacterized protein YacL